jgi:nitrogen fixation protein FixH
MDHIQAERKAKRMWVSLVVLLLGIQLLIGYVSIRLATGDPTVAIVPNYHEEALKWDQHKAELSAPARLGLEPQLEVSSTADGNGFRAIVFALRDTQGRLVTHLDVVASVYRHARASEIQKVSLSKVGEGKFMATLPMSQTGLWQIDVKVRGAAEPILVSKEYSL